MARGFGGRRRGRSAGMRLAFEHLEARRLLNASIDIAADGSLVYKTDPAAAQTLVVSRTGNVYTFAVGTAENPIDVTSNAASLPTTGSGTTTVTVTGPARLQFDAVSDSQTIRVQSTGVATQIVLTGDSEKVILGDDVSAATGGVRALQGPITVSAATGSELNSLLVDDGPAVYAAGVKPTYAVSATTITSTNATVAADFKGITYSGVSTLTVKGTSDTTSPSPLYLIKGTAGGVVTTIDGSVGPAHRDFSIIGTASATGSKLAIKSAGDASVSVASIDAPVTYQGGASSTIYLESVRGTNYGIDSDFVVLGSSGAANIKVANFWNHTSSLSGTPNWFLTRASGAGYAALRDQDNPAVGGLFFQPGSVHSLGINASGNQGASLMVDYSTGDPLPYGPATGTAGEPNVGLTYVGATGIHPGSKYALAFVGSPPSGAFSTEAVTALPLYRGTIALTEASGGLRNIAYQLTATAPLIDDATTATSYRWFYDIMAGAVDGQRTLPDGTVVSAKVDSTLTISAGVSITEGQALALSEANAAAYLASYLVSAKSSVRILRGWSLGSVTTVLNYVSNVDKVTQDKLPVDGLQKLSIEDASPASLPTADVIRIQSTPIDISVFGVQNDASDSMVLYLAGTADAISVGLDGGSGSNPNDGEPYEDKLFIAAGGLDLSASNFVPLGTGSFQIPALPGLSTTIAVRNYEDVQVYNSSALTFTLQPKTITTTARSPLVNVVAGILTTTIDGFSPEGLAATIVWGDGTYSDGTIQAISGNPSAYEIVGTHTYTNAGVYTPKIYVSGAGTTETTIAGVPITFQVDGSSGTTATAPALYGRLAASSDSGVSDSDGITNVVLPTFQGVSGIAGAWIDVYAITAGAGGTIVRLGSVASDAAGAWTITSTVPLADGTYTIQAVSTSTSTWANGSYTFTTPLVIDTVGPRIWSLTAAPLSSRISIGVRDFGGQADAGTGVDLARARDAASYTFATSNGAARPIASIIVSPGSTNGVQTVSLTFGSRIVDGAYLLTVLSSAGRTFGIQDIAGNPLDGSFSGTFPSGGSNTGADFRARLTFAGSRLSTIRKA
ncbi:Ig-like domain-containing protein [Paludisphaera rhizosphaerae]|uniref:Ig-like domain-containing protein n=1 Tax=Paludisphaera rhizosphaerae TaxID=2711216 RepID=UPI0013EA28E6|nr:Ig-like domain-containing protein [Paludisphaera rhizosphaerae]